MTSLAWKALLKERAEVAHESGGFPGPPRLSATESALGPPACQAVEQCGRTSPRAAPSVAFLHFAARSCIVRSLEHAVRRSPPGRHPYRSRRTAFAARRPGDQGPGTVLAHPHFRSVRPPCPTHQRGGRRDCRASVRRRCGYPGHRKKRGGKAGDSDRRVTRAGLRAVG